MRLYVEGKLCSGQGRCYSVAPALFAPDDEGYNTRRDTVVDVAAEHEELGAKAARVCPEGAITVMAEA